MRRLVLARDVVGFLSRVGDEETSFAAAAIDRSIGAIRSGVDPVLARVEREWSRQLNRNGVLVQAEEVAARRCHRGSSRTRSQARSAVAFRNARPDVIAGSQWIEVRVRLDVNDDSSDGHGAGRRESAIGGAAGNEKCVLIGKAGRIEVARVKVAPVEQARVAERWWNGVALPLTSARGAAREMLRGKRFLRCRRC